VTVQLGQPPASPTQKGSRTTDFGPVQPEFRGIESDDQDSKQAERVTAVMGAEVGMELGLEGIAKAALLYSENAAAGAVVAAGLESGLGFAVGLAALVYAVANLLEDGELDPQMDAATKLGIAITPLTWAPYVLAQLLSDNDDDTAAGIANLFGAAANIEEALKNGNLTLALKAAIVFARDLGALLDKAIKTIVGEGIDLVGALNQAPPPLGPQPGGAPPPGVLDSNDYPPKTDPDTPPSDDRDDDDDDDETDSP
jgi:hypothetical protein